MRAWEAAAAKAKESAAADVFAPNKVPTIDFSKIAVEPLFEDAVDFETFSKSDFRAVKVKDCVAVPKSKKLLQFTLDDGTGEDRTILSGIHAYYEPEELVGKTCIAIVNLPPRKMMGVDSCGMLLSAIHGGRGRRAPELAHGRPVHPGRRKALLARKGQPVFHHRPDEERGVLPLSFLYVAIR